MFKQIKMFFFLLFCTTVIISVYLFSFSHQTQRNHHPAFETITFHIPPERIKVFEKKSINVVGLGDSLTEGVGDPFREGYVGIIKEKLETKYGMNVNLKNEAKKGLKSKELVKRIQKKSVRHHIQEADLIFLTIGGNDIVKVIQNHFFHLDVPLFEKESHTFARHLEDTIEAIREINEEVPIFMIGLFNPYFSYFSEVVELNEIIHIWNKQSKTVLDQFQHTHFIAVESIFIDDSNYLLHDDKFHPNREGYKRIADAVMDELNELLTGERNETNFSFNY